MATLQELLDRRAVYLAAELKILQGQEYVVGQGATARRLRRADLTEVRQAIAQLDAQITALQATSTRRVYTLVPHRR